MRKSFITTKMEKLAKVDRIDKLKQHSATFIKRCFIVLSVLTAFLIFSYIPTYKKYGFSINGKLHHSYLDYPNEISSKEAIELSEFMESLDILWNHDKKIYYPFDMEADGNDKYWIRQIDVKDRFKRDKVIHDIATDLGIGEKFPLVQANTVTEKIKDDIKKKIAFPPEYLKMKHPPRPHVPQCDVTKLLNHKITILSYSLSQFRSTSIKLDGLFNDGGRINIRTTTSAEDVEQGNYNNNIKLNLTLFAQSDDLFKHVSLAQIENYDSTSKTVHINSHHHLGSCLVYNLDIIFPSTLASYKDFNLIANHATKISGDLNSIVFKKFRVGVGRGAIDLKNVKSEEIMVGTLNGIVLGSYQPTQKLGIAAVEGATMVEILPRSKNLKSTVVTLNGPVKAIISDGLSKSSRFITHCWFCQPSVESKNPEQVHVTSSRRKMIKIGYFNQTSNAHINVHSRHGESKLIYN